MAPIVAVGLISPSTPVLAGALQPPVDSSAIAISDRTKMSELTKALKIQLPRSLRAYESIGLTITTGPLPLGSEIRFLTKSGQSVGAAASFSGTDRSETIAHQMVISSEHAVGANLELFAVYTHPDKGENRAPTEKELISIKVSIIPR